MSGQVFAATGPVRVVVDVSGVDLSVRATETTDVSVAVEPHSSRASDADLAERTSVGFSDDRLVLRSERTTASRLRSLFGTGPRVDVYIVVPTGSSLEVRGWGDVAGIGVLGSVDVDTAMGDVDLDEVGSLRVKVSAGDVRVRDLTGRGDLRTSAGAIRVGTAHDDVGARTSAGDVVVDRGFGSLRLSTSAGDVRVGDASTSVTARTSAGDIRLDRVRSGAVDAESTYGQLTIGVPEGTAAWLDVQARHGVVRSDLVASDGPGDAAATVEVRAVAGYGDVVLHRV
ncbi:DUF4097 family beta strand repeat-containing protein [Kineococcus sp. SYSU DK003]|uniref:DUF4097 family beta strand repeat-containing protein n=1 Tax=Kineococcus sp. SYSU DK003 TaxID=3383124 RepID=UPI003D7C39DC